MELNNMDTYKERYEAALKRAQDFENGIVHFALKPGESIVHWIFPELRESEDERTRKEILHYILYKADGVSEEEEHRWIAYLEKQKEQKPNVEICPHSIKSKSYKENGCPIEDCDYGLEIAYDILKKTFGEVRGYQTDDGIREHQTAIEAVRKAKEQKPAEIDEEHKVGKWFTGLIPCWIDAPSTLQPAHRYHGKNVIAIHLKDGGYRCCCVDDKKPITFCVAEDTHLVEGWKDRKPVEWSEEDEDMLNSCISSIEEAKENRYAYKETDGDTSYDHEIAWLKSLRPSWKPSEEQMEALQNAERLVRPYYPEHAKILAELYEQLEKL